MKLLVFLLWGLFAASAEAAAPPVRLGFIGSLSGFAANYGMAVLEGLELAQSELQQQTGRGFHLLVEDDRSVMRDTVSAYHKLRGGDRVQVIVGGSWWLGSIAKLAERDGILLLSCETLFNDETPITRSYFILGGRLRPWVSVFDPVAERLGLRSAAVIRSTSGFGVTLGHAMEELFSGKERKFLGTLEYSDLDANDAANLALRLERLAPQAVYIDAHPGGLANVLRKMEELQLPEMTVFTNSIADDMIRQGLFSPAKFPNLYFTRREAPSPDFAGKFRKKFRKEPYLSSDLGYYSGYLAMGAIASGDAITELRKGGIIAAGVSFRFDEQNVWTGPRQEVWHYHPGMMQSKRADTETAP